MENTKKIRILVVEDEVSIQQVICFFLKHNGFEALGVSSGQEALRAIPEFQPHLLILDLVMHPISGWDVLKWLRSHHLTPALPVIILSSLVQLTEQMHGFEEGAVEYITKPVQPSTLVERVRAVLAMSNEQRAMLQHKRLGERRKILERLNTSYSESSLL